MKKYRMFFIGISIFITGMLWAQTNVEVPVPNAVISALDTAELSAMTVKTEVRESEQEKELNVIRFGLDDEIIEMLDDFIKNETYYYLDEFYELFLRTKSISLREKIISYFTAAEDDRLSDYALEILEDPFDTRTSTVTLLFKYATTVDLKEAAPIARQLLENDHTEYFDSALSALAEIGSAEDAVFLAEYLDRDDLTIVQQQSVMKALGNLKAVETWDALVAITQDEDRNSFVRMYAAEAIGAMEKDESVPVLAELFESTDPNFRASVVKGLSHYPGNETAEAVIIEAVRDSHYKVRLEAVAAVKELQITAAIPYVVYRAKNDPESAVKYACYDTLGASGTAEGMDYLVSLMKEPNIGDTAKSKAAEAIIKYGDTAAVNTVIALARETLADDKKKTLRYALGKLFASTENPAFAEICREYLQSQDVATAGTGLDIYAKNKFPSVTADVQAMADAEKESANRTKARKILDRD